MKSKAPSRTRGLKKVKIHLPNSMGSMAVTCAAVSVVSLVPFSAQGQGVCASKQIAAAWRSEVGRASTEFGSRLIAVGRVDSVSPQLGVEILGRFVLPGAGENFQVGDYAAVVDWSTKTSKERILEVRPIASRYVPGASEIYLKAAAEVSDTSRGQLRVGKVDVDYSTSLLGTDSSSSMFGKLISVYGTQPVPRGVVLSSCVSLAKGSLGTGSSLRGSLGTGRPDGSLGTGKPDGSLGTGKPDGSLGTGSPDGSLGTGNS